MNRDMVLALCASLFLHAGLIFFCPVPPQPEKPGKRGTTPEPAVLGVVMIAASPETKPAAGHPAAPASRAAPEAPAGCRTAKAPAADEDARPPASGRAPQARPAAKASPEPTSPAASRPATPPVDVEKIARSIKAAARTAAGIAAEKISDVLAALKPEPAQPARTLPAATGKSAAKDAAKNTTKKKTDGPPPSRATKKKAPKVKKAPPAASLPSSSAPRQAAEPSAGAKGRAGGRNPTKGEREDIRTRYLSHLLERIQAAKYYPAKARRLRHKGTAKVSFTLHEDGTATDLAVESSSGYEELDRAALQTVRRAAPFRPIPKELGKKRLLVAVPISYHFP